MRVSIQVDILTAPKVTRRTTQPAMIEPEALCPRLGVGRLVGLQKSELLVASSANIGGPATASLLVATVE